MERYLPGRILLVLSGLSLAAQACARPISSNPVPFEPTRTADAFPPDRGDYYNEVLIYYPELSQLEVIDEGKFVTNPKGTNTERWFNFSDMPFNFEAAQLAAGFFEGMASAKEIIEHNLNGQPVNFLIQPMSGSERVLFIVPWKTPPPSTFGIQPGDLPAAATTRAEDGTWTSYVRVPDTIEDVTGNPAIFLTIEEVASRFLIDQLAASTFDVYSSDANLVPIARGLVNRSIADAFTLRQMGVSWEDYRDWAEGQSLDEGKTIPIMVFSENFYNSIPQTGMPFGVRTPIPLRGLQS